MTIKCAWCGAWMGEKCPECGEKAGQGFPSHYEDEMLTEYRCGNGHRWTRSGNVSHGICEDCYQKHSPRKEPKA